MTNRDDITKRLLHFVSTKKWSKSDFARVCGIHRQNVDRYLSGQSDPSKIAIKLITEGLNLDWLLTGEGEMMGNKTGVEQSQSGRSTPVQQINDDTIQYQAKTGTLLSFIAIGRSMTPDKIQEGDYIIIDTQLEPKPGDYVLKKTPEGPEIIKHKQGDPSPIGVLVKLVRNCT